MATYGQLAALAGRPRSARAAGQALRGCPEDLPWHRVVNARGGISPRAPLSSVLTQRLRLEAEGVRVRGGRVSLARYRWPAGAAGARRRRTR